VQIAGSTDSPPSLNATLTTLDEFPGGAELEEEDNNDEIDEEEDSDEEEDNNDEIDEEEDDVDDEVVVEAEDLAESEYAATAAIAIITMMTTPAAIREIAPCFGLYK
jgi:hypothetical protein